MPKLKQYVYARYLVRENQGYYITLKVLPCTNLGIPRFEATIIKANPQADANQNTATYSFKGYFKDAYSYILDEYLKERS